MILKNRQVSAKDLVTVYHLKVMLLLVDFCQQYNKFCNLTGKKIYYLFDKDSEIKLCRIRYDGHNIIESVFKFYQILIILMKRL